MSRITARWRRLHGDAAKSDSRNERRWGGGAPMAVDGRPNGRGRGDRGVVAAAPTRLDHQKRLRNPGAAVVSRGGLVGDKGGLGVAVHARRGKSSALSPRLLSIWSRIPSIPARGATIPASPPPYQVRFWCAQSQEGACSWTHCRGSDDFWNMMGRRTPRTAQPGGF